MRTLLVTMAACFALLGALALLIPAGPLSLRLRTRGRRGNRGLLGGRARNRSCRVFQGTFKCIKNVTFRFGKASRREEFEQAVPQMIDMVVLGLQAGLSFDQAFMLYADRFESDFAQMCQRSGMAWQSGLASRSDALRDLATDIDVDAFHRMVDLVTLALQYGVTLTPLLLLLADDARKTYRARVEEQVLKAGTRMLIPTGLLILPALLMIVMGPAIIQIVEEFF